MKGASLVAVAAVVHVVCAAPIVAAVVVTDADGAVQVRKGDVLTWQLANGKRVAKLSASWEFERLQKDELARTAVTFEGTRDGKSRRFTITPAERHISVRAQLDVAGEKILRERTHLDELAARYESAGDLARAIDVLNRARGIAMTGDRYDEAFMHGARARELAARTSDGWAIATMAIGVAEVYERANRYDEAVSLYRQIYEAADSAVLRAYIAFVAGGTEGAREHEVAAAEWFQRCVENEPRAGVLRAGCLLNLSMMQEGLKQYRAAMPHAREAVALLQRLAPDSEDHDEALGNLASIIEGGSPADALRLREEVLAIRRRRDPQSRQVGMALHNLSISYLGLRDFERARSIDLEAKAILERHPDAMRNLAAVETNLAIIAVRQGRLDEARAHFERALEMKRQIDAGPMSIVSALGNLAQLHLERGEPRHSIRYLEEALEIVRRVAPGTHAYAATIGRLADVVSDTGDFERAEKLAREALELIECLGPGTDPVVESTVSLANVLARRDEFDAAIHMFQRALLLDRELPRPSGSEANILLNLGELHMRRGDMTTAQEYIDLAVERLRDSPGSPFYAWALQIRATLAFHGDDYAAMERLHRESLKITSQLPESLDVARDYIGICRALVGQNRFAAAEEHCTRAVEIRAKVAPDSNPMAEAYMQRGMLRRILKRTDEALADFEGAMQAFESHFAVGGGTAEARLQYREVWGPAITHYVDLLVATGKFDQAFAVVERFRGRELIALLAGHESRAPREDLQRAINTLLEAARSVPPDSERAGQIHAELAALRAQTGTRRDPAARVPPPIDTARARELLEDGTLMIVLVTGEERTNVLMLTREQPVAGRTITIERNRLRERITALRKLLDERGEAAQIRAVAGELSSLLFGGEADRIAAAHRIVISPDGPLHQLPFALLWSKPVVLVPSATVLHELRSRRVARAKRVPFAGFGNPSGPDLAASAEEVTRIARLFGPDARTFYGTAATAQRVREMSRDAAVVHFACHAVLDERTPLGSALLLAPEGNAGKLRAWEIFDTMETDADLVTLSACDSALGREVTGEGLAGLTRAFLSAGARSVVATLWRIEDESARDLMVRFYQQLRDGKPRAEALAAAQQALASGGRFRHPSYWAGFVLMGDWR